MFCDVDDDGVVVEDEVLFELDVDDELDLDEEERKRLNMHRIALESPSPIVDR
jgi:hypothetical protein